MLLHLCSSRAGRDSHAVLLLLLDEHTVPVVMQQLLRAGDDDVILLEVVRGMGEALVGNHPGAALAATARKSLLPAAVEAPPAAAQLSAHCIR